MAKPIDKQWKQYRLRRWFAWILADLPLAILMAGALSVLLVVVTLKGRLIDVPDRFIQQLNAPLVDLIDGYDVTFDRASFGFGSVLHPRVMLGDVTVQTDENQPFLNLSQLELTLDGWGILTGRMKPVVIALDGTVVQLDRNSDGQFNLAFANNGGQKFTSINDVFNAIEAVFQRPDLDRLETLSLNGLTVRYNDQKSRNIWTFDGGRFLADRDVATQDLRLRADLALLAGGGTPATLALSYRRTGTQDATLTADVDGIRAPDLAGQAPALAWLKLVDAPISGSVRTQLSASNDAPLFATLDLGEGTILPDAGENSISFTQAKTYFSYAPSDGRLDIETLTFVSDWGKFRGQGYALLNDGQFVVSATSNEISVTAPEQFDLSLPIKRAGVDLRISTAPTRVEIAQGYFQIDDSMVRISGDVGQTTNGWEQRFDGWIDQTTVGNILAYWPDTAGAKFRKWVADNVDRGTLKDVSLGLRQTAGQPTQSFATFSYDDAKLRFMQDMPLLSGAKGYGSVTNSQVDLYLSDGFVPFDGAGRVAIGGSTMQIPDFSIQPPLARFDLALAGPASAVFAALDRKPMEIFKKAGRSADFAKGHAQATLSVLTPLKRGVVQQDVVYQVSGQLRNFSSDSLVPGQNVRSDALNVDANPRGVTVHGPVRLGAIPADITWTQKAGTRTSNLRADLILAADGLRQFNVVLPPGTVSGSTPAQLNVTLQNGHAPEFQLTSSLQGLGISIPAIAWSKARKSSGQFRVEGTLAETPDISGFEISAPDLKASGDLELRNGRLAQANINDLAVGSWLSGAVRLRDRGRGRPMAVNVQSARLDIRSAPFGRQGQSGSLPPLSGSLRSLVIANGLSLTDVNFDLLEGSGRFSGRVNGGAGVNGQITQRDGQMVIDITSDDAAGVLRDMNLMPRGTGGKLFLTLAGQPSGGWRGRAQILNTRVKDAPVIAEILSAVSVIGILEQLDGNGLVMSEILADFGLKDDLFTLYSSSAVGPSLGLSLDGYINTRTQQLDLQGVVSPLYLVNAIGAIFTRRGEGLIGFNFTLKGPISDVRVGVNPLSAFTPGLFREIFRRPPPEVVE